MPRIATTPGIAPLMVRLYHHVSRRRRVQGGLLLLLTLASSVAEVVSLGAVIPFIGILTQPEKVLNHPSMGSLVRSLDITRASELVLPLTIAFGAAALAAGTLRVALAGLSLRLASATGTDISVEVYRRTLYQPYAVHVARSSSEIIAGITQKVASVAIALMSIVGLVTSTILFLAIMIALLVFDWRVALAAMLSFGVGYALIALQTRRRLARNSECIAREQTAVVKALQEGLGAIRDVLLDGTQDVYTTAYGRSIRQLQRATAENIFINQAPRFVMETLGMVLVAALAYVLTSQASSAASALPILGALGVGAQRLLPLLQQMYGNWSYVSGMKSSVADVLDLLDQPLPEGVNAQEPEPLAIRTGIAFDDIRFRYGTDGPWVLDGIDFEIPKGARIGIIGTTGSGKSTALDLLMSLLEPTAGRILVDGQPVGPELRRAWQRTIAHVPQTIYLADATIAANIAFGVPPEQIDMARVRRAAEQAQIAEFIDGRLGGYSAIAGERGVSLSGGQRQRIGIARALYKQASVLIFDEATNALDTTTEDAVMGAIEELHEDLTVVLVAHRLSTLEHCDTIIRLDKGRVVAQGPYAQVVAGDTGAPRLALDDAVTRTA